MSVQQKIKLFSSPSHHPLIAYNGAVAGSHNRQRATGKVIITIDGVPVF